MDDGGSAFPSSRTSETVEQDHGMSLRDWLAGQSISSVMRLSTVAAVKGVGEDMDEGKIAVACYNIADCMIREKRRRLEHGNKEERKERIVKYIDQEVVSELPDHNAYERHKKSIGLMCGGYMGLYEDAIKTMVSKMGV